MINMDHSLFPTCSPSVLSSNAVRYGDGSTKSSRKLVRGFALSKPCPPGFVLAGWLSVFNTLLCSMQDQDS
jgi:hypothetical protein